MLTTPTPQPVAVEQHPPLQADVSAARTRSQPAVDGVDAYGEDSFPASDPPSWWAGA